MKSNSQTHSSINCFSWMDGQKSYFLSSYSKSTSKAKDGRINWWLNVIFVIKWSSMSHMVVTWASRLMLLIYPLNPTLIHSFRWTQGREHQEQAEKVRSKEENVREEEEGKSKDQARLVTLNLHLVSLCLWIVCGGFSSYSLDFGKPYM